MGRIKGSGEGARREKRKHLFFLLSPSPLSFFRPRTYRKGSVRVTISTLPNLPLSENQRWWLQQYHEDEQGFAYPKYACTAG